MADYPLLFRIIHVIRRPSFEVRIVADGRVLMTREDGEWWCHGIEPGGLSENGEGPLIAFERFRTSFRHALDDLAEETGVLEGFRQEASMLFSTDRVEERRWLLAADAICTIEVIDEPFRGMHRMRPRPSILAIDMLSSLASAPLSASSDAEALALPEAA